jgi:hypothetical protein
MRLERSLLLEKLEEKTPAHVDDSEGSESELSSVTFPLIIGSNRSRSNMERPYVHNHQDREDEAAPLEHPILHFQNNHHHRRHTILLPVRRQQTHVSMLSCKILDLEKVVVEPPKAALGLLLHLSLPVIQMRRNVLQIHSFDFANRKGIMSALNTVGMRILI